MRSSRRTPGLRCRNEIWYANKVVVLGSRRVTLQRSLQTRDLRTAEAKLLKLERDLVDNYVRGVAGDVRFADAASRYLEETSHLKGVVRAAYALQRLVPQIGGQVLREICDQTLEPYKQQRLKDGVSAATINKEISYVRRILNLAARKWRDNGQPLIASAPMITDVSGPAKSAHILTRPEESRLLSELPAHLRDPVIFSVNTGLRSSEQSGLKWADERLIEELGVTVFVIERGKTKNSTRVVPLNEAARSAIDRQRGNHPEFVWTFKGRPVRQFNNKAFRRARRRAGLSDLTWHAFRHAFSTRLRAAEVSLEDRASLLGHAVPGGQMTTLYSAAEIGILIEIVDRLAETKQDVTMTSIGHPPDEKAAALLTAL